MTARNEGSHRGRRVAAVLVGLLLGAVILVGCGGAQAGTGAASADQASSGDTQSSQGGGVTVAATWDRASGGTAFKIAMDTHSVDLDGYDLSQLATLRTDQGVAVAPSAWSAEKGGHHRSGTLTFPATIDGKPVIAPGTGWVELVVRNVAGVPERTFRWTP